jgi:hypothetical protein
LARAKQHYHANRGLTLEQRKRKDINLCATRSPLAAWEAELAVVQRGSGGAAARAERAAKRQRL